VSAAVNQLRSITREGHERLRAQLAELVTVRRPEVARWLREARDAGGGPEENPDHLEALEEHAMLERRIATLRYTLALAEVVDYAADGSADIGAHVRLRMLNGVTVTYQLVGVAEADPSQRQISTDSPVGEAILGRRAGDIVEVRAPRGTHRIEILEIDPAPEARAA
jgi:transcription elongation factor GreA